MTTPVGGLRARYLHDSVRLVVNDILTKLQWYVHVSGRLDLNLLPRPAKWDEPVDLNSVAVAAGHLPDAIPAEVGSNLAIRTWTFFVDFFAENESIGIHLINDLREAFAGNMPSIGYTTPFITIYDFSQATPPAVGRAEITSLVSETPPPVSARPWANDLHVLIVELEDTYGDENDA